MEETVAQQQEHHHHEQIPEQYLEAQRAAVEAVEVGRATSEAVERQGDQLKNADRLADQTKYALDQSTRVLKGMTWSGWVQNMFAPKLQAPDNNLTSVAPIPLDEIPPFAEEAAEAIQTYRVNLMVLEACETNEQRQTCLMACNNMFDEASKQLNRLQVDNNPTVVQRLSQELSKLHQHQNNVTQKQLQLHKRATAETTASIISSSCVPKRHQVAQQQQQQEDHLNFLSSNLGELNIMASSLNEQMTQHNQIMTRLDVKSDDIHEQTRAVTRRADRMVQKSSWTPPKKVFEKWVSIKHKESGRYISVELSGKIIMVDTFHPEKCVYGVWMRKSGLFGLKNKFTNRFLGQTMLGSLSCSSSNFGQREEWQADEDNNWESSKLLIASAGWGNGGYVSVRSRDGALRIVDKANADVWCLADVL